MQAKLVNFNKLISSIKSNNPKVCINLMYGHKYLNNELSFDDVKDNLNDDYFDAVSIVDPYGCLTPDDVGIL